MGKLLEVRSSCSSNYSAFAMCDAKTYKKCNSKSIVKHSRRVVIIHSEIKEIDALRGHSKDPERYCFDGDSTYVTGSYENTLVRLLGIDAPEIRGLSLYYLEKSGFLDTLDRQH